jgi:5-methylcytosine-specific restriction endonuclease McrA
MPSTATVASANIAALRNPELDHTIPLSQSGSNTEKNLQVLCAPCNHSKGNP